MYLLIEIGQFTDLKKDLRKTVWAMIALYHMIFYMILKLLQVVNQIRFVQFSIVGSIMF